MQPMRAKMKSFFDSGPWGAIVAAFSAPVFAALKPVLLNTLARLAGAEPTALSGIVIPLGAFPVFFGAALIFGYLGGLLGGVLQRRRTGIALGGLLGGLVTNLFFTLK